MSRLTVEMPVVFISILLPTGSGWRKRGQGNGTLSLPVGLRSQVIESDTASMVVWDIRGCCFMLSSTKFIVIMQVYSRVFICKVP